MKNKTEREIDSLIQFKIKLNIKLSKLLKLLRKWLLKCTQH